MGLEGFQSAYSNAREGTGEDGEDDWWGRDVVLRVTKIGFEMCINGVPTGFPAISNTPIAVEETEDGHSGEGHLTWALLSALSAYLYGDVTVQQRVRQAYEDWQKEAAEMRASLLGSWVRPGVLLSRRRRSARSPAFGGGTGTL